MAAKSEVFIPINILNDGFIAPVYTGEDIKVIEQKNNFLAISKPINTHMHPHFYSDTNTVLNYLMISKYSNFTKVREHSYDRSLLYRLDYETSGLVMLCLDSSFIERVREKPNIIKEKIYFALIRGRLEEQKLETYITYKGKKNYYAVKSPSDQGEYVSLEIKSSIYLSEQNLSLLQIKLDQGRRHQIRAQLSFIGHPIIGDELYGGEEADRLYLHCYQYTIGEETFQDSSLTSLFNLFDLNCKL